MPLLSALAVISVFQLIAGDQSPVMEDPLIESFRQQQQLLENIEREMTVKHGETNDKIDDAFRQSSQQMDNIAGDITDMKGILTDLKNELVKPCPDRYIKNYYGCYKFGLTPVTAYEAKKNCNDQLVTVTSVGEQLALLSLMVKNNVSLDNEYWIAGQTNDNKFVWGNWDPAEVDSSLLTPQHISQISQWLPNKSFRLLYRATRDGMSPPAFHQKCDNQGPTLSVGVDPLTGNLLGGYTTVPWASSGGYKTDPHAFIFQICQSSCSTVRYNVKSGGTNAVYHSSDQSPRFGLHNLHFFSRAYIFNTANQYFELTNTCCTSSNYYTGTLSLCKPSCGPPFKWKDVEVFAVTDGHTWTKDCMALKPGSHQWVAASCSDKYRYICEV